MKSEIGRREMSLAQIEDEIEKSISLMHTFYPHKIASTKRMNPQDYSGFLVVARNRVPAEMFPDTFLEKYGLVQHYSEERIVEAEKRRRELRSLLKNQQDRFRIVLPEGFVRIEELAVGGPLAQWPDATGGREWSPNDTREICESLRIDWGKNLLYWNPSKATGDTLPDCWFFFNVSWMMETDTKIQKDWKGVMDGVTQTIDHLTSKRDQVRNSGDPNKSREELREEFDRFLSEIKILKVSPAHTGTHYAGYEILDNEEKLEALNHLSKVVSQG